MPVYATSYWSICDGCGHITYDPNEHVIMELGSCCSVSVCRQPVSLNRPPLLDCCFHKAILHLASDDVEYFNLLQKASGLFRIGDRYVSTHNNYLLDVCTHAWVVLARRCGIDRYGAFNPGLFYTGELG